MGRQVEASCRRVRRGVVFILLVGGQACHRRAEPTSGMEAPSSTAPSTAPSAAAAPSRSHTRPTLEVLLNGRSVAKAPWQDRVVTGHIFFNLPRGTERTRLLLDERLAPPDGMAFDLAQGDTIELRLVGASEPMEAGWSGEYRIGQGQYDSPSPRFRLVLNDKRVGTVGNPKGGSLSVDWVVDGQKHPPVAFMHATGSDDQEFRHWAFPRLQDGNHMTVTLLGPGGADRPGKVEPRE